MEARERRAAEDVVGGLLADHDRRGVEVAVGDAREDRAVGDAQALDADDAALGVDHRQRVVAAAEAGGAAGVVGALDLLADEAVELVVARSAAAPGWISLAGVGAEGGLGEDLAGQPDAVAEVAPVLRVRHVVEADRRGGDRVGALQADGAAGGRAHRADMGLEAVAVDRGAAVVADRQRQEVELDVGVVDARRRSGRRPADSNWFEVPRPILASSHCAPIRAIAG